ncbi:hypothetical protein [Geminocystis sp. GBBB08]|uniref:hypothetical protein n=1 Tax=Geminocystis sp. GBBB08 TaxID=2604140 RepID=UPI0027E34B32|nr:hypothetical protein [Geminocystis sp. GBBB08]MBL1211112.1 hypothetical protein [Geminocystis sp. GBBB08]
MTEIAMDILILNLYQNDSRKTGKIHLPHVENLVYEYKEDKKLKKLSQENKTENFSVVTTPLSQVITDDVNQNNTLNEKKIDPVTIDDSTNHNSGFQVNVENLNMTNPFIDNQDIGNQDTGNRHNLATKDQDNEQEKEKLPSFNNPEDLDRIILELYLEEIAENLVKPSKKALTTILESNIMNIIENYRKLSKKNHKSICDLLMVNFILN